MKFLLSGLALSMLASFSSVQAQNFNVVKSFSDITAVKNGEVKIPVVLNNVNRADVNNVTLTVSVAGEEHKMTVTPVMMSNGENSSMFYVTVQSPSVTGASEVEVTVDAVNGAATTAQNTSKGNLMTVSRNVDHKVVIEKYTALWCPSCPTGIVGIQRTKKIYGDKVIVIESHKNDAMMSRDYQKINQMHSTIPRATVDRDPSIGDVNPYLGTERGDNGAGYGLGYDIDEQMAIAPVVEVKVSGGLEDNKITINSEITSLYTGDANLGVAYVFTQDSLSSPNWKQSNNLPNFYRDHEVIQKEPLFEKWFNGDFQVTGVVYDDIVRGASEPISGHADVIPVQVKEEETYTHSHVFDLKKYAKMENTDYVNLIVMVIDNNTGKIVNAASAKLSDCNAVEGVETADENVTETARYTLDGRRISTAVKGVNIVKYSDGTVKKVVVE